MVSDVNRFLAEANLELVQFEQGLEKTRAELHAIPNFVQVLEMIRGDEFRTYFNERAPDYLVKMTQVLASMEIFRMKIARLMKAFQLD